MPEIGVLTPSGSVTITRTWVPEFLIINSPETDNVLSSMTVTIGGQVYQSVTNQGRLGSWIKYMIGGMLGASVKVGNIYKLADGFIKDQTLQLTLVNATVNAYVVYGYSTGKGDRPFVAGEITIQASSYEDFDDFTALFFDTTNLLNADIVFADGHSDRFITAELQAMFVTTNITDANGNLGSLICIDNRLGNIASVRIYTTGAGAMTVLQGRM